MEKNKPNEKKEKKTSNNSQGRDAILKEQILNSSEKKMGMGLKPGPIQSTAQVRRGSRKKAGKTEIQTINTPSKKK